MVKLAILFLLVFLATVAGIAQAHTPSDIRVRKRITSIDRSGSDIEVRGYVRVKDHSGAYTIARCTVVVRVGGDNLGQDSVTGNFFGGKRLHWHESGSDPGGKVTATIKHCHPFADA